MIKIFEKWLQALGKLEYVTGKEKPKVECILCAIRDDDKRVKSLKVYQDNLNFIVLNLYPYNVGHAMVCTTRHVAKYIDLTKEELIRAIRFMVAAEYEAVQLYMQLAESTDNKLAIEVLKDIADEERVHAGEFLRLLHELAPDEEKFYAEGAEEVEEEISKLKKG